MVSSEKLFQLTAKKFSNFKEIINKKNEKLRIKNDKENIEYMSKTS